MWMVVGWLAAANRQNDAVSLKLFTVFHLNLAYSSIEEDQRPEVVRRCYWPILRLAGDLAVPLGIEATGFTLEAIAGIDPAWLAELKRLIHAGRCEFVGSGYMQIIGPLVPAEVNAWNLRLGHEVYERLLGLRPQLALVNEQAYSAGLVGHYVQAGYKGLITEWDNPFHFHPEWESSWRYLPQYACGTGGAVIPVIWNKSIAFQKFQRYAQREIEIEEYMAYLAGHVSQDARAFPLYGNDAEIFDFRPGRFGTEPVLGADSEWKRIDHLIEGLKADGRFEFVRPSQVLDLMGTRGAGHRLKLESPEQPVPVKKQGKYNLSRWSVTGHDNLAVNTLCWRAYEGLKARGLDGDASSWRELCYLWGSDFRTHTTEKRWSAYVGQLKSFTARHSTYVPISPRGGRADGVNVMGDARLAREGRFLNVETSGLRVKLNCRRGLAIDAMVFKEVSDQPLCGTLPHGYFDDISMGADFYTGHVVVEMAGRPKITDLVSVDPVVFHDPEGDCVVVQASVSTPLGVIHKEMSVGLAVPRLDIRFFFDWAEIPPASFRLGAITLLPEAFDELSLFYRTNDGGFDAEEFGLATHSVNQGDAESFLVSSQQGFGLTGGFVEIGDARRVLRVEVDRSVSALLGMLTYRKVKDRFFGRLVFSAREMDETSMGRTVRGDFLPGGLVAHMTLSGFIRSAGAHGEVL